MTYLQAMEIDEIFTVVLTFTTQCQIDREDSINFCGLRRKLEPYNTLVITRFLKAFLIPNVIRFLFSFGLHQGSLNGTKDYVIRLIMCVNLQVYSSISHGPASYLWLHQLHLQCQLGCGIIKMLGPKMQDFCPRIIMLKENCFKSIL